MTCYVCGEKWDTEIETEVISVELEFKEGITLSDQVTEYFSEGFQVGRSKSLIIQTSTTIKNLRYF